MGKFDGILMASDLDNTLLCTDKSISQANLRAIERFEAEGGLFSFVTGRPPIAMAPVLEQLRPKIPYGCLNGGGVYDPDTQSFISRTELSREAFELVEYVAQVLPTVGFELLTFETSYLYRSNEVTEELRRFERLPDNYVDSLDIPGTLCKILFGEKSERIPELMRVVESHPKSRDYTVLRTAEEYYELLPKGCNKGKGLLELAKYLGIDPRRTIALGDNSNDAPMLQVAGLGIAVKNANEEAKSLADLTLPVTNDEDAISYVVEALEDGRLSV